MRSARVRPWVPAPRPSISGEASTLTSFKYRCGSACGSGLEAENRRTAAKTSVTRANVRLSMNETPVEAKIVWGSGMGVKHAAAGVQILANLQVLIGVGGSSLA